MAYLGEEETQCNLINEKRAFAVIVSGAKWNPCGHGLLYWGGNYYHVAGSTPFTPSSAPVLARIPASQFSKYLRDHGKTVEQRIPITLPEPCGAYAKLQEVMHRGKWVWLGLPNNCFHFLEEVIQAGGGDYSLVTNCHLLERPR